jgi:hypothetical protein
VTANQPLQLPWRLLLLDLIGTLLIAMGMYELLTPGTRLLPEPLAFSYYEWVLILAGLAIMLPAVRGLLAFLAQARRR